MTPHLARFVSGAYSIRWAFPRRGVRVRVLEPRRRRPFDWAKAIREAA